MIPALIIYLLKKYREYNRKKNLQGIQAAVLKKTAAMTIIVLITFTSVAQEQLRKYNVIYHGDKVGDMQFRHKQSGDTTYFKMITDVKMRVVFKIDVFSQEESIFKNDRLIYSNVHRTVNGNPKLNLQTKAVNNNRYITYSDGKAGATSNELIDYNLARLYLAEPITLQKVYSDVYQQFLPIQKTSNHTYKITLPDGNYNYYTYRDGICNKVDVHHTLYSLQIVLNN